MKNWFCLLSIASMLAACSANPTMMSGLRQNMVSTKQYATHSASLEEIAKLKPQAVPPIKIAVAQPSSSYSEQWSAEEMQEIESWLPGLKSTGLVREIVVIPASLRPTCEGRYGSSDCGAYGWRMAAATLHADAVLMVSRAIATDSYVNPLSLLNLTVIGMWVVPAHHRDSYALYQAHLQDVANGYIYGTAYGDGASKSVRPLMYEHTKTGQSEASLSALKILGRKIIEAAQQEMVARTQDDKIR